MSIRTFSNEIAKNFLNTGTKPVALKKIDEVEQQEAVYRPVMIELSHLLEKTHTIYHEDEIISRIGEMGKTIADEGTEDGIFWQDQGGHQAMLMDERTLTAYRAIFEEYLDPGLVENLRSFLAQTNKTRLAEYEAASEEDQEKFKKINVVTLN